MKGDKIRLNGETWTVHKVYLEKDVLALYRWHDVIAKQVTCSEVAYFQGQSK